VVVVVIIDDKLKGKSMSSFVEQSESITELSKALCKCQSDLKPVTKKAVNPFYGSKYADLSTVIEAVRRPLSDNGLSVVQFPVSNGVTTILLHTSGEWMRGFCPMPSLKEGPQARGSSISYARRYSLMSVLGLPADDDDGNIAMETTDVSGNNDKNLYERAVFLADQITNPEKKKTALDYVKTNSGNYGLLKTCISRLEKAAKLQEENTNVK